jgi:hypothetical protein
MSWPTLPFDVLPMNLFEIAFANSQKKILKALQQKTNYIFILVMTLVGSFFQFF